MAHEDAARNSKQAGGKHPLPEPGARSPEPGARSPEPLSFAVFLVGPPTMGEWLRVTTDAPPEAWSWLREVFLRSARRLVRRTTLDVVDADDVAHEALRRWLSARLDRFSPRCPMFPIVQSFTRHEFLRALRRTALNRDVLARIASASEAPSRISRCDARLDFEAALAVATPRQAGALALALQGHGMAEIARRLECSPQSVRRLLGRFARRVVGEDGVRSRMIVMCSAAEKVATSRVPQVETECK